MNCQVSSISEDGYAANGAARFHCYHNNKKPGAALPEPAVEPAKPVKVEAVKGAEDSPTKKADEKAAVTDGKKADDKPKSDEDKKADDSEKGDDDDGDKPEEKTE